MVGTIFNIQKFCLHDGPGIRTTVFFKGCNLRCKWCANPESQKMAEQMTLDLRKCIGCGSCIAACPQGARTMANGQLILNAAECTACGVCLPACAAGVIGKEGRTVTVAEVVEAVIKDKVFYDHSGGGVTFSGGEVLLQSEFAGMLAEELRKNGIHVAMETAGAVPEPVFAAFLEKVDYVLMDLKHYDSQSHIAGTGVDNRQIIENIQIIRDSGVPYLLRIPVIPGFNDCVEDARKFAELLQQLKISTVELLPFHQMGQHKYELLGVDYAYVDCLQLHTEDLRLYRQVFEQHGIHVKD